MENIKDLKRYDVEADGAGIYFLYKGDEIVYVGQAEHVYLRVGAHKKEGKRGFDSFSFMPFEDKDPDALESYYILKLQPKYNSVVPLYVNITSLRNRVKEILGRNVGMREFRKAILELEVDSHYFKGYQVYFKYADKEIARYLNGLKKPN